MSVNLPPTRGRVRIDAGYTIVNIVLLLIFFFLVAGNFGGPSSGAISPSRTADLPLERLPRPLLVVDGEGMTLNGTPVAPDLLGVALDGLPQPVTLHLVIDRAAPASTLVKLLDDPQLAGRTLKLVTVRQRRVP